MTTTDTTPARVGRERICTQCGTIYRSPRASSLYCSRACRSKANRGTAPKGGPKAGPTFFSPLTKLLLHLGFIGKISSARTREPAPVVYALTVPADYALNEARMIFDLKGWGQLSEAEFRAVLKADGIQGYSTDSAEAVERKRLQARHRAAAARL